ncbi:hypothetical protein Aspvir_009653 [Aspergillus viridinutans]|uniref:Ankyrin n=1 Tax=Aspergillus viridinutans TaxID=75553 RepID=A0A9P3BYT7_ASPVI|nr:uncharacterized protein Aspvir_009653 [Aspergillus viridinutans]GIK05540.1 hypothetical protein Aspvir_009653 [Aspergillus viridinutans]
MNDADLPGNFYLVEGLATPLVVASSVGYAELVETLLQHGAAVDMTGLDCLTPLMAAASAGHTKVMELLLAGGADASIQRDGRGSTALERTARWDHTAAVRLLLQFDPDQSSISWDIALAYAAEHGNIQMVRMFLDAGARTSVKYARFRPRLPLIFCAVDGDHPDVVSLLLERGEDIECRDVAAATPLIHAAKMGSPKVLEMLLRHGADVNARDRNDRSPLYWGRGTLEKEMVDMLLEYGAELEPHLGS